MNNGLLTYDKALDLYKLGKLIEFRCVNGDWSLLRPQTQLSVDQLLCLEFRLKQFTSRIEDMNRWKNPGASLRQAEFHNADRAARLETVNAICDFLSDGSPCSHVIKKLITKEFLEPR